MLGEFDDYSSGERMGYSEVNVTNTSRRAKAPKTPRDARKIKLPRISMYYGEIRIEIPASKDMDGMYIRIDGIQNANHVDDDTKKHEYRFGAAKGVGILTKDEYIEEVLKSAIRASDAGKGTLPPAVNEAGKYFGWTISGIRESLIEVQAKKRAEAEARAQAAGYAGRF